MHQPNQTRGYGAIEGIRDNAVSGGFMVFGQWIAAFVLVLSIVWWVYDVSCSHSSVGHLFMASVVFPVCFSLGCCAIPLGFVYRCIYEAKGASSRRRRREGMQLPIAHV